MNQVLRDDPKLKKHLEGKTMLGRISDPHEQAGLVIFMLSDYSSCAVCSWRVETGLRLADITGSDHLIDGGTTAW